MPPVVLPPGSPLSSALCSPSEGFSLLSYNILLPNSVRGWWIPKYYEPSVAPEQRTWPHRQALLRQGMAEAQADVLCLQELIPESAEADMSFLREAGYDHVLHRKGDLRCGTFWRRDRFSLGADPQHKDRTLLTSLRSQSSPERVVQVINVHLKAGSDPARRLRQVDEALGQVHRSLPQGAAGAPVVIAGDFNSEPRGTAVERLLQHGEVDASMREERYPAVELTSRLRRNPLGPFVDAYAAAFGEGNAPPTLLLPDREAFFFNASGALSEAADRAIRALFARFAADGLMSREATIAWITTVNGKPGRGSEWDKAQAALAEREGDALTEEDMVSIYEAELREGKPWGVVHDLVACGALDPVPSPRVLSLRFDQIHFTGALSLSAVSQPLAEDRWRQVQDNGVTLPNAWHPSDHLPVGAAFRWT
jgi:exonuclease III